MHFTNKMILSFIAASSVFTLATSAGNEYLPPPTGYTYQTPSISFPIRTTQPTFRPTQPPPTPRPTRPTYLPPAPTPGPTPSPHDHHEHHDHHDHHDHHHHHEPGMPFDFAYTVNEDDNNYSHNAISDGDITRGEYRVALPDGRTQIVKYTADWKNGFNAEVSYEGEARYPDQPTGFANGNHRAYAPPSQGGGYHY